MSHKAIADVLQDVDENNFSILIGHLRLACAVRSEHVEVGSHYEHPSIGKSADIQWRLVFLPLCIQLRWVGKGLEGRQQT